MGTVNHRRMPALFVGHGSPMNAVEDNAFHRSWVDLAQRLPRPKVVLCVSAHWETRGVAVTASSQPSTIHDFGGFPKALFDVQYPAPGSPQLAAQIADLLAPTAVRLDHERGLDHGAWSVLNAMYPDADIPVVQLSLATGEPGFFHFTIGRKLATLREHGVLILASGNIVHNLQFFNIQSTAPLDWAAEFDCEIRGKLANDNYDALTNFQLLGKYARLAIPTPEHFLPLLYAVGAKADNESLRFFNTVVMSAIAMTSLIIGDNDAAR
jgi:4,5-DOPA dioxygenase extradiol